MANRSNVQLAHSRLAGPLGVTDGLTPGRTYASGVEVGRMNEYKVTIIGAGFESSANWIYSADSPPAEGDEIEIACDRSSIDPDLGISRERVRVEAIHADGSISVEELS